MSGTLRIGGDLPAHRLGYGAMQRIGPASGVNPLAWLLRRFPVTLPIRWHLAVAHREDNVVAASLEFCDEEDAALTTLG